MEKDNKKSKSPFAFLQDKMAPKVHYHMTVLSGRSCIPTKSNVYYCLQFPSNWRFLLDFTYKILKRSMHHPSNCVRSM